MNAEERPIKRKEGRADAIPFEYSSFLFLLNVLRCPIIDSFIPAAPNEAIPWCKENNRAKYA